MVKQKTIAQWKDEVLTIQEYLDESYPIDTWGIGTIKNFKKLHLAWGRTIIEKFVDRLIPVISGGAMARASEDEIANWIQQAVEFGNASMIVSDDGKIRIPSPVSSFSQKTPEGSIFFQEALHDGHTLWAWDEQIYFRAYESDEDVLIEDAQIFTLFYRESNLQPYGQSRLSKSIRQLTTYGSRVMFFIESVAAAQSHKQLIFTNINQDIMQAYQRGDAKGAEDIKAIKMGVHDALMIGEGDKGEVKVSTIDPTDPSPLIKVFERIAASVATAANLEPREFGNAAAVAPSAEAQFAANSDLILEVSKYSRKIHRTVLGALVAIAEANGEVEPQLYWADPAIPSQGAAIDAFQKKSIATNGVSAQLKSSWLRGGFSTDELKEAEERGFLGVGTDAPELILEVVRDESQE